MGNAIDLRRYKQVTGNVLYLAIYRLNTTPYLHTHTQTQTQTQTQVYRLDGIPVCAGLLTYMSIASPVGLSEKLKLSVGNAHMYRYTKCIQCCLLAPIYNAI